MVRRQLTRCLLAASALAACLVPGARAADGVVARGVPAASPHVVGDRVLFARFGKGTFIWSATRGRAPRELGRLTPPPNACDIGDVEDTCADTLYAFDASETHLAAALQPISGHRYQTFYGDVSVSAGKLGGPRSTLESCPPPIPSGFGDESTLSESAPAVDGSRIAYVSPCGGRNRLVVHDAGPPAADRSFDLPAAGDAARLAGPYAAAAAGEEIVVFDLRTGTRAYSVSGVGPYGRAPSFFDLQEDGKLVVADATGDACSATAGLRWHSSAEPQAHRIRGCPAEQSVRIGGDHVAYLAGRRGGRALVVSSLDGAARDVGTLGPYAGYRAGREFDFDGETVAFTRPDCIDSAVVLRPSAAAPRAGGERLACSLRAPRSARVSRSGRVALRVRCPQGCNGAVRLRLGARALGAAAYVTLAPGASKRIALRVRARRDRRLLARRGNVKAQLRMTLPKPLGRVTRKIRLRAPR